MRAVAGNTQIAAPAAGLYPATDTPAEFAAFIRKEAERWSKVVAESGMKYD